MYLALPTKTLLSTILFGWKLSRMMGSSERQTGFESPLGCALFFSYSLVSINWMAGSFLVMHFHSSEKSTQNILCFLFARYYGLTLPTSIQRECGYHLLYQYGEVRPVYGSLAVLFTNGRIFGDPRHRLECWQRWTGVRKCLIQIIKK